MVKELDNFYLEVNLLNPFSGSQISLPLVWNFYHKMVSSGLPSENNFVCMLLHSQCRELAFWVTGANSWRKHSKLTGEPFEDVVFCNGSFYLLADGFNIWQIDVQSIYSSIKNGNDDFGTFSKIEARFHLDRVFRLLVESRMLFLTNKILRYLVESCGELLLVCRFFSSCQDTVLETQKFEVYALDFCQLSWKKVEDLGDQMLFLGKCCSTSFSAKELGVGIRNNIYFCNDHLKGIFNGTDVNKWGIFTLGKKDSEPFCFYGDIDIWAYTWLTAPSWWCYRNIPPIRSN